MMVFTGDFIFQIVPQKSFSLLVTENENGILLSYKMFRRSKTHSAQFYTVCLNRSLGHTKYIFLKISNILFTSKSEEYFSTDAQVTK